MSDLLINEKKELDLLCNNYALSTTDTERRILERKIISTINKVIITMQSDDENTVYEIITKINNEMFNNREIILKACELAIKTYELSYKDEIYIETLLKALPYINELQLVDIIKSDYFITRYPYIITKIINYINKEKKYYLFSQILLIISSLRTLNYQEIIKYYINEVDTIIKANNNHKDNQIINYINLRKNLHINKKLIRNYFRIEWYLLMFLILLTLIQIYILSLTGYLKLF